ncbi:MAG: hypothetical protein ACI8SE_000281 [Bacteroidia bacterium]|jgi:hypothetical protein
MSRIILSVLGVFYCGMSFAQQDTSNIPEHIRQSFRMNHSVGLHVTSSKVFLLEYSFRPIKFLEVKANVGRHNYNSDNVLGLVGTTTEGNFGSLGISLFNTYRPVYVQPKIIKGLVIGLSIGRGVLDFSGQKTFEGNYSTPKLVKIEMRNVAYNYGVIKAGVEVVLKERFRLEIFPLEMVWAETKSNTAYDIKYYPAIGSTRDRRIRCGLAFHVQLGL